MEISSLFFDKANGCEFFTGGLNGKPGLRMLPLREGSSGRGNIRLPWKEKHEYHQVVIIYSMPFPISGCGKLSHLIAKPLFHSFN